MDEVTRNGADDADDALSGRQRDILGIVKQQGFATIESLARHFQVSAQTVRRDIIFLDDAGLLQRFHGGAGTMDGVVRLGYVHKRAVSAGAKERIGRAVADLIADGASVFLDVGTTVEEVARALRGRRNLRVFTCSLGAAAVLAGQPSIELFVAGGMVRGPDGSLVGEHAIASLSQFRVDIAVIGFSGFDDDGALMDFDMQKVAVKRSALAHARQGIAVGDAAKFSRSAIVRIAPASDFKLLVSDALPPTDLANVLTAQGLELRVA